MRVKSRAKTKKPKKYHYRFEFGGYYTVYCTSKDSQALHDRIQRELTEVLARASDGEIAMQDCKTGRFKGSVSNGN